MRQIFQEQAKIPEAVEKTYLRHRNRRTRSSLEELKTLLQLLVQDYTRVFILIDALDEYNNTDRSRDKLQDELLLL